MFCRLVGHLPLLLTWVMTGAFALAYALQAVLRHEGLRSNALDLGYEDQVLWNTLHGRPFAFSLLSGGGFSLDYQASLAHAVPTLLGYHAELLLAPLSLLYAVIPDVRALLAFQALAVCAGALAAFGLARRRLHSDWAGCFVALAYLCSPFVEAELLSDFHTVALDSALFMLLFYLIERRWLIAVVATGIAAAAAKEDAPVGLVLLGLWALLLRRWRSGGILLALVGAAFALFDFGWLIPHFSPEQSSPFLARYGYLGNAPLAILAHLIRHPATVAPTLGSTESRSYFWGLLGSSGGLPLLSPLTLLVGLPSIAINVLSTFPWMRTGMAHYSALVLPVLIASAVEGIQFAQHRWELARVRVGRSVWRRAGAVALAAWLATAAGVTHYQLGAGPGGRAFSLAAPDAHARQLARFLAQIPADDAVSTSSSLAPHLSHRQELYLFPNILDAQDILLDLTTSPFPVSWEDQRVRLLGLLQTGDFGVADAADGYVLLRRGAPLRNLPRDTFSFVDGPFAASVEQPLATFGPLILLGADIRDSKVIGIGWQETLTLDVMLDQPVAEDDVLAVWTGGTPRPLPPDFAGAVPALIWRPTSNWQPGQIMHVAVPPLAVAQPQALQIGWFNQASPTGPVHWLPCVEAGGDACPLDSHFVVSDAGQPATPGVLRLRPPS